MSNNRHYSFARNFFSRPENDDTIEQFKKEYMTSMKNYQLAMEGNKSGTAADVSGRFDEASIRSPPKKSRINNNNSNNNNINIPSSRISSAATLSSDDHQELSILRDEVKSLIDARNKDSFDRINFKSALNNLDSRLNNLESLILNQRKNTTTHSDSSRPNSYQSMDPRIQENRYDYMLKDQLRRNGYRDNNINSSNAFPSSPPSSKRYSSPIQRYQYDSYSNTNSNRYNDYQKSRPHYDYLYRMNNINNNNNRTDFDDISTIDILNGKI